jgi:hypothetical protein
VTASSGQGGRRRGGGGQAGDSGEGEDDFVFHLTKEEFMQVFFDDLALPNLIRTTLADTPEYKTHRAGFSSDGTPNNLHVVRSMRGAIGRRIALGSESRRELHRLEALLEDLLARGQPVTVAPAEIEALEHDIEALRARILRIPYPRPDRSALPQSRADAGADRQGGHVLPDGCLRFDGRGAQGSGQALLHPALPLPDPALRKDRHRLHPPSHAGAGGQ